MPAGNPSLINDTGCQLKVWTKDLLKCWI